MRPRRRGKKLLGALAHIALGRALVDGTDVYDCRTCEAPGMGWMKDALGHDGEPDARAFWTENLVTGEPLTLCPVRLIQIAEQRTPALASECRTYWSRYYPLYKEHGRLLADGGMADQPARFWAFVDEIERLERLSEETYRKHRPSEQQTTGGT